MKVSSHAQHMPHVHSGWARKAQIWDGSRATHWLRTPCKACWENSGTPLSLELQLEPTREDKSNSHATGSSLGSAPSVPVKVILDTRNQQGSWASSACLWQHFGKWAGAGGRQQRLKLLQAGDEGIVTQVLRCSKIQENWESTMSQALKWWKPFMGSSLEELPGQLLLGAAVAKDSRRCSFSWVYVQATGCSSPCSHKALAHGGCRVKATSLQRQALHLKSTALLFRELRTGMLKHISCRASHSWVCCRPTWCGCNTHGQSDLIIILVQQLLDLMAHFPTSRARPWPEPRPGLGEFCPKIPYKDVSSHVSWESFLKWYISSR